MTTLTETHSPIRDLQSLFEVMEKEPLIAILFPKSGRFRIESIHSFAKGCLDVWMNVVVCVVVVAL